MAAAGFCSLEIFFSFSSFSSVLHSLIKISIKLKYMRLYWQKSRMNTPCINDLFCLRKSLLPHILASFTKLNDFISSFCCKVSHSEHVFLFLCWIVLSRIYVNSVFSVCIYSSKGKSWIHGKFWIFSHFETFLSRLNVWYYIYIRY